MAPAHPRCRMDPTPARAQRPCRFSWNRRLQHARTPMTVQQGGHRLCSTSPRPNTWPSNGSHFRAVSPLCDQENTRPAHAPMSRNRPSCNPAALSARWLVAGPPHGAALGAQVEQLAAHLVRSARMHWQRRSTAQMGLNTDRTRRSHMASWGAGVCWLHLQTMHAATITGTCCMRVHHTAG